MYKKFAQYSQELRLRYKGLICNLNSGISNRILTLMGTRPISSRTRGRNWKKVALIVAIKTYDIVALIYK